MLITIRTTHEPATDIGFLLHKNPNRCQNVDLGFGILNVLYPKAAKNECCVALLLDIDPIDLIRGKKNRQNTMPLEQYVNDRPYVSSSFFSVALTNAFSSTLNKKCSKRPELVDVIMPFTTKISILPCNGGEKFLRGLFEPLGYRVEALNHTLDDSFPDWGNSKYFSVTLYKEQTLSELLNHLYVLIPVLDNQKHYYIDDAEVDKLLKHGEGWLETHPERDNIAKRYLKHKQSYTREALMRLTEINPMEESSEDETKRKSDEEIIEKKLNLNDERLKSVVSVLKSSGAVNVIDLGCGEGKLLELIVRDKQFQKIVGMDVAIRSLERASERLRLNEMPSMLRQKIDLMHGSLMYKDARFSGYDAAAIIEVIEHLDAPRLSAFERVVFEFAKPRTVIITTPNIEYNALFENLSNGKLRHLDHRFEWTRNEFEGWADAISKRYNYEPNFFPIGSTDEKYGSPTQMAVFNYKGS